MRLGGRDSRRSCRRSKRIGLGPWLWAGSGSNAGRKFVVPVAIRGSVQWWAASNERMAAGRKPLSINEHAYFGQSFATSAEAGKGRSSCGQRALMWREFGNWRSVSQEKPGVADLTYRRSPNLSQEHGRPKGGQRANVADRPTELSRQRTLPEKSTAKSLGSSRIDRTRRSARTPTGIGRSGRP